MLRVRVFGDNYSLTISTQGCRINRRKFNTNTNTNLSMLASLEKQIFCVVLTYSEVSCRSRAKTAMKYTKKRDALAKLCFLPI